MAIKLIALDIDGTLTNQPEQVSRRNSDAIRRAIDDGIAVVLATGRGLPATRPLWKNLDLHGPCIIYGGAIIVDTDTERLIKIHEIPSDVILEVLEYAAQEGIHAQIYVNDVVYFEKMTPLAERYVGRHKLQYVIDPELRNKAWTGVPKVLCLCEADRQDEVLSNFCARFDGIAQVSRSNPGFIEINCLGVTKGSALEEISNMLGIQRADVAAAGDNYLDLEMIEWAGLGACVEDGAEQVKAAADMIIPPCGEDGVAVWIETSILSE